MSGPGRTARVYPAIIEAVRASPGTTAHQIYDKFGGSFHNIVANLGLLVDRGVLNYEGQRPRRYFVSKRYIENKELEDGHQD